VAHIIPLAGGANKGAHMDSIEIAGNNRYKKPFYFLLL
jgi:hypothetical protein